MLARVRDDRDSAVQGENRDVALPQAGLSEGLAHQVHGTVHHELGDSVARRDGQPLTDIDLGERDLAGDVVDDRAGDVELGGHLDALQPGRRVDLHHQRPVFAFEHVDAGHAESHDLRRAHGRALVDGVEFDRLDRSTAVHIRAELVTRSRPSHRGDDAVAHDEGADVTAAALGDELLNEHVLLRGVQRLDDGLGDLHLRREDHADALGAFEQLDHHGRTADPLDRGTHVGAVANEGGGRHRDVVAGEDLVRPQLVARAGDPVGRVGRVDVHLLELAHDGRAEVRDRVADARKDRVVIAELAAPVMQVGLVGGEVDREAQRVEHLDGVTTLKSRGSQSLGGVRLRRTGEHCDLHGDFLPGWSGEQVVPPFKHPYRVARMGEPA